MRAHIFGFSHNLLHFHWWVTSGPPVTTAKTAETTAVVHRLWWDIGDHRWAAVEFQPGLVIHLHLWRFDCGFFTDGIFANLVDGKYCSRVSLFGEYSVKSFFVFLPG